MEVREKITATFATLRPFYFRKFLFFSTADNDDFEENRFTESATQLFRVLDQFSGQMEEQEPLEIEETFLKQCDELITDLDTPDFEAYLSTTDDLIKLLNTVFPPVTTARDLEISTAPTDMNRRMLEEVIKPQQGIVNIKSRKFRGTPKYDEFKDLKGELRQVRERYEGQLFKNIALVKDVREINKGTKHNRELENATKQSDILQCMEEVKDFFEGKIKQISA